MNGFVLFVVVVCCWAENYGYSSELEISFGDDGIPFLTKPDLPNNRSISETRDPTQGKQLLRIIEGKDPCPLAVQLVNGIHFRASSDGGQRIRVCVILPNATLSTVIPRDFLEGPLVEEVASDGGICWIRNDCLKVRGRAKRVIASVYFPGDQINGS